MPVLLDYAILNSLVIECNKMACCVASPQVKSVLPALVAVGSRVRMISAPTLIISYCHLNEHLESVKLTPTLDLRHVRSLLMNSGTTDSDSDD